MHSARFPLARASRGVLFAVGAVALVECGGGKAFYGAPCLVDGGCGGGPQDAAAADASFAFGDASAKPDAADGGADAADDAGDAPSD